MITPQVLNYIRSQLAIGVSRAQIEQDLLRQGWLQQDINEAFMAVGVALVDHSPSSSSITKSQKLTPTSEPQVIAGHYVGPLLKQKNTFWLLVSSMVAIAVLMYFCVRTFVPSELSLFAMFTNIEAARWGDLLLLLPAVILGVIFLLISWRWGRRIYKKENRPIQSFFFGTSLYLLLIFLTLKIISFTLVHWANMLPEDGPALVGLVFSAFFLASIPILFVGLLLLMGLLIFSTRSSPQEPLLLQSKLVILTRYFVIGFTAVFILVFTLYVSGAVTPIASVLNQKWLCNFVYRSRVKSECFFNASMTTKSASDATQSSDFTIVKTDYKEIYHLQDVGGKLAYNFRNKDGTSGVVYDGQVVSGKYEKVGPVNVVGGSLAYTAYKGDKKVIVWDGKEYGEQYDDFAYIVDVGGKLAYWARIGKVQPDEFIQKNITEVAVWDGKEYGTDFAQIVKVMNIGGKLAFYGRKISGGWYIVVGDRQYGPYGFIHSFEEEDGHAVAQVQSGNLPPIGWQDRIYDDMGDQSLFYVVDGREIGKGYEDIGDQYIFVDGKFAFSASKNGKTFIVYDGEETAIEGISLSSRLYNIQGKLAYYIKNPDGSGSLRLMMGGQNVGPKIPADGNFSLSNGGKVAIQTKNANGDTVVYLDGKEVYQSKVPIDLHSDLKFFGEKIFFLIHGGKISIPWYDGKKIGQNFYGYDYFTLVNGKLDFVAFDEGEKQYYLILEK